LLLVVFDSSLHEIRVQKNRGFKLSKTVKIRFGEYALVSTNESKMELIQLTFIKRLLKKLLKKRKKIKSKGKNKISQSAENKDKIRNNKIWINILPNYVLSKKSKNSRMGKGKGSFLRWVFRLQHGVTLVEFLGIPYYKLVSILMSIRKRLKIKLILVKKSQYNNYFSCWTKFNSTFLYFNKYRYM